MAMSEHWRSIIEHMPFVLATGAGPQIDTKTVVTSVIVAGLTAFGSVMIGNERMTVQISNQTEQIRQLSADVRHLNENAAKVAERNSERLSRLEGRMDSINLGMSGMAGAIGHASPIARSR